MSERIETHSPLLDHAAGEIGTCRDPEKILQSHQITLYGPEVPLRTRLEVKYQSVLKYGRSLVRVESLVSLVV